MKLSIEQARELGALLTMVLPPERLGAITLELRIAQPQFEWRFDWWPGGWASLSANERGEDDSNESQ